MDNPTPDAPAPKITPTTTSKNSLARVAAFLFLVLPMVIAANLAIWAAFNHPRP